MESNANKENFLRHVKWRAGLLEGTERAKYLEKECRGNSSWRKEIEKYLTIQIPASFMETPAAAMLEITPEVPGFSEIKLINAGGMGRVYIGKRVDLDCWRAIKVLHQSVENGFSLDLFKHEVHTLASLDDSAIAKVYQAGITADNQPFFEMEFVRKSDSQGDDKLIPGVHLTAYCDEKYLRVSERIEIFLKICDAISYAHSHRVIHRDLKPANLLITEIRNCRQPKVIDFGIAKVANRSLDLTPNAMSVGYASPEQLRGEANISSASDVFSLGIILFELLTGERPSRIRDQGEVGSTVETYKASSMVTKFHEDHLRDIAKKRSVPIRELHKLLQGDLDAILARAIRENPADRYSNVVSLSQDLQCWLQSECIDKRTRQTPKMERVRKLARRHPTVASLASVLIFVLFSSFIGITLLWRSAERHAAAETRERGNVEKANQQTQNANLGLQRAITRLQLQSAEDSLRNGDVAYALAMEASILRANPSNQISATRLLSALGERSFHLPASPLLLHNSYVRSVDFSPDGTLLATTSEDKAARIWEVKTGRAVGRPLQHASAVTRAQFSPDGMLIATCSWDCTARLWEVRTGLEICPPMRHKMEVTYVSFSGDGTRLVTTSADGSAQIWQVPSGEKLGHALDHGKWVHMAEFSPDGKLLVTASKTNAFLWDAWSSEMLAGPFKHDQIIDCVTFSPDSEIFLTASRDRMVRGWNTRGVNRLLYSLKHSNIVNEVRFSPDGGRLVSACADGTAHIWDAATGASLGEPLAHGDVVSAVRWNPNGASIVTSSVDSTACLWDALDMSLWGEPLRHDQWVGSVSFSPDGKKIATGSYDYTVRIWDVRPVKAIPLRLEHLRNVRFAQFIPDKRVVITMTYDGKARIWDPECGKLLNEWRNLGRPLTGGTFNFDGSQFVTASDDGTVEILETATGSSISGPIKGSGGRVKDVVFSPNGSNVAAAYSDGTAYVMDARSGHRIAGPLKHGDEVNSVRFSPNGTAVATSSHDGTARLWNASSGAAMLKPIKHGSGTQLDTVFSTEFSPDGSKLVTASRNGGVFVWNVSDGRLLVGPLKHNGFVLSAEFSPDGRKIVSSSFDHTARIWDAETGQQLTAPLAHRDRVYTAHFSFDGMRIVTASKDGTARVWDVSTGLPLTEPFRHRASVRGATFSRNGTQILTYDEERVVHLWEIPTPPPRAPGWLSELAEVVAGKRLNQQGVLETVDSARLEGIKQNILHDGDPDDFYNKWGRWFVSDAGPRTISAFSTCTIKDYIESLLEENTVRSLHEALLLDPSNATVLSRLSVRLLSSSPATATQRSEAEFLSAESIRLAPNDDEVIRLRREVSMKISRP